MLLVSLFLAFAFTLQGINWGRVECWNPDEVALRSIFKKSKPPFEPATFTKPPFHTYLTYFTVLRSVHVLEGYAKKRQKYVDPGKGYFIEKNAFNDVVLIGARLLTLALYLGSVSLAFAIARRFFGLLAARITALLMGTSAGFIGFNHYLTADSPMIFWMLLALFFCQRILLSGKLVDYLLAGFIVGLASATKYNALAVGLAIPVAHLLRSTRIKEALFGYRMILGVLMVPVGFIAGCPYAVLDHRKFVNDFMYNYEAAPNYHGYATGHSYVEFLRRATEIFGWPGATWIGVVAVASVALILVRKSSSLSVNGFVLAASVFVLYYLKFGSFSRIETRFVLPVMPFLVLMMGPFLELCTRRSVWIYVTLIPVLFYNCICSYYVGIRFADDPRMAAQTWVRTHLPQGASIESTQSCSNWNRIPGVRLDARHAPNSNERAAIFAKAFTNNPWIMKSLEATEGHVNPDDFTPAALQARNPEYLALDSIVYSGLTAGPVKSYFLDILAGRYPYRIVFDLHNPPVPGWIYPRQLDFVENRITILQRIGGHNGPGQAGETEDSD